MRTLYWISVVALAATRVAAQQVQGSVTVVGGSATDVVGTTSRALTIAPALAITPDPRVAFGLAASGTRYDDQRWSLGAQASGAGRIPMGSHAAVSLDAGGGATGTSYDFSYATANALPAIEGTAGPVTGYAGVSAAVAATRLTRQTPATSGLFGLTPSVSSTSIAASRASKGIVAGANLKLTDDDGTALIVGLRQSSGTVDTTYTTDRTASVSASNGRVTLGGAFGVRAEPGASTTFGSGTLTVAVDSRLAVELAGGSYAADRLIGTPGGRYLTLGLSLRTGRSVSRLPTADGVQPVATGFTRLTIRNADARRVEIAGDFTNWKPVAATRAPNGVWFADLRIPPGQYRYAFRIDGTTWAVPDGAAAVNDGFGGKSAWLTISDPPNRPAR